MVKQALSVLVVSGMMLSGTAFAADAVKAPVAEQANALAGTVDQGAAKANAIEKTGAALKNGAPGETVQEKAAKAADSSKHIPSDAASNSLEKAEHKAEKPVKGAAKKATKSKMN
ncbi:MAG: hypothetical protein VB101_07795 [Rhodospirillaceae bacterium]|nr:hypothetical protein [Rhodospirillaceae bacterium]